RGIAGRLAAADRLLMLGAGKLLGFEVVLARLPPQPLLKAGVLREVREAAVDFPSPCPKGSSAGAGDTSGRAIPLTPPPLGGGRRRPTAHGQDVTERIGWSVYPVTAPSST